jgi:hypothetical protein
MASPVPIPTVEADAPPQAVPVYFLAVPELAYKALSDAAAKRNLSIAQLLSVAVADFLKKTEGV